MRRGLGHVNTIWKDARRILKYVEYCHGTEFDAMERELEIKKLSHKNKEELILNNSKNKLVSYKPLKGVIVLKKNKDDGSEVLIRLKWGDTNE